MTTQQQDSHQCSVPATVTQQSTAANYNTALDLRSSADRLLYLAHPNLNL